MADITKEQVVTFIENMTSWNSRPSSKNSGRSSASPPPLRPVPRRGRSRGRGGGADRVRRHSHGRRPEKIKVIKEIRTLTGLGLKEAKAVVDEALPVKEKVSKEEAENIRKVLEAAGATVQVK
jgi:large subunit ribosomal protein L7/L12